MKQIIIVAMLCALAAMTACTHKEQPKVEEQKFALSDTMQRMIQTDTVRYSSMAGELSLSGVVGFNDNNVVKVYARSGGQILEAKVSLGDKVSRGQTLAILQSADVAGNYSDLSSATADLAIAKRQADNAEALYKNGISSEKEYIEANENYEKAKAMRNKVQSLININGGGKTNAGGQYIVTSPIDGYIVEKKITAGAFIRPDMADNLFTISDMKTVWVYANVYEADIAKIKEGNAVKVMPLSYPGKVFAGKIDKVTQMLDPQSKAMKVRISLDNSELLLKPDMFAKVMVNDEEGTEALCIPTAALIYEDGKNYVVVYKSINDIHIVAVDVLRTTEGKTYVKGGLSAGEVIITRNQLFIFNQLMDE